MIDVGRLNRTLALQTGIYIGVGAARNKDRNFEIVKTSTNRPVIEMSTKRIHTTSRND